MFCPDPRHDLVYEIPSKEWKKGAPLGNGHLGVMAWGDGSPLCLTLDRDDLWDLRVAPPPEDADYNWGTIRRLAKSGSWDELAAIMERNHYYHAPTPAKLPVGRMELWVPGRVAKRGFYARLSLRNATLTAQIGAVRFEAFVAATAPVIAVRFSGGADGIRVRWRSLSDLNAGQAQELGLKRHRIVSVSGVTAAVQRFPDGTTSVVAWKQTRTRSGTELLCTIATSRDGSNPVKIAAVTLDGVARSFAGIRRQHLDWWRGFWGKSGITIPEKRLETLWYYGLYKLASSSRAGHLPANLQGLWVTDGVLPPWVGEYAANMNVQETYWPVYATNHLELGTPLYDWVEQIAEGAKERTRKFFGWDGLRLESALAADGTPVPSWGTVQFWPGAATWLAHHFWLHWRYSQDLEFLRRRAYPLFRACMDFWVRFLEEDEDGFLHVPLSYSPELGGNAPSAWGRDTVVDLSLIRNLCAWLIESSSVLNVDAGERGAWQEIAARLVPYPKDESGALMVMDRRPLPGSHRHHSHLMPLFPLGDVHIEGTDDDRRRIDASMTDLERKGMGEWTGWSFPWASLIASRIGRGEMAATMLRLFLDSFVLPNGLHVNGDWRKNGICIFHYEPFTMEAECAATAALTEMLLQSWGGRIRLFPAVPAAWPDAAFSGLLAERNVSVSAVRTAGTVEEATFQCPVATEISVVGLDSTAEWTGVTSATWNHGLWSVVLRPAATATARQIACKWPGAIAREPQPRNIFGLRD